MIYNYEAEFLQWIHNCIPEIRQMTYASDEDLLTGLDTAKKFPAFYYSRANYNIVWNKPIVIAATFEDRSARQMYPYEVTYKGTMLIENQQAAFNIVNTLKFLFRKHPYIMVKVPGITEEDAVIKVQLLPLSFTIDDVRLPNDKNGACRAVRFMWKSNLLLTEKNVPESGIVELVNIKTEVLNSAPSIGEAIPEVEEPKVGSGIEDDGSYSIYCKNHI